MNLRFITLITAILLLVSAIAHFNFWDYEAVSAYLEENPDKRLRQNFYLFQPLFVEVPLAFFLLTLFIKQK